MEFRSAGVIGAGAWGTALAQVTGWAGLDTLLQAREPEVVESIRERRINEAFLPEVVLDDHVKVTPDIADLAACDMILAVPPAQHLRSVMTAFAAHYRPGVPIVLCSKGIERGSLKLMTEVLAESIPGATVAVLSGPSFAADVSRGLPTAVTLACADAALGEELMWTLSAPGFRPYLATDLIGAEAGGALKNVLAIACGIVGVMQRPGRFHGPSCEVDAASVPGKLQLFYFGPRRSDQVRAPTFRCPSPEEAARIEPDIWSVGDVGIHLPRTHTAYSFARGLSCPSNSAVLVAAFQRLCFSKKSSR